MIDMDIEVATSLLASKLKQHEATVSDILGIILLLPSLLPIIRVKTTEFEAFKDD